MHMLLPQVIFYVFAGLTVLSAILVITQNNPVRCVLFLVAAFFTSAILWMLVRAEFLALILVLVYIGAVMTLFLFVVMMLNIDVESMKKQLLRHLPFGLLIVALLVSLLMTAIPANIYNTGEKLSVAVSQTLSTDYMPDETATNAKVISNTEMLGNVLYTDYLLAFEIAAVILLVAIIAAITLVHRHPIRSKRQNIVQQIMTRRDDRVTLIKMKSEK